VVTAALGAGASDDSVMQGALAAGVAPAVILAAIETAVSSGPTGAAGTPSSTPTGAAGAGGGGTGSTASPS
jgi:hypothetical protein